MLPDPLPEPPFLDPILVSPLPQVLSPWFTPGLAQRGLGGPGARTVEPPRVMVLLSCVPLTALSLQLARLPGAPTHVHTHTRAHTRAHAGTHTCTHTQTHGTLTHVHTPTHTCTQGTPAF